MASIRSIETALILVFCTQRCRDGTGGREGDRFRQMVPTETNGPNRGRAEADHSRAVFKAKHLEKKFLLSTLELREYCQIIRVLLCLTHMAWVGPESRPRGAMNLLNVHD